MAKNGNIYDLLVELKKKANLEDEIIDHIRVTATNNGKIQKELDHNYPVTSVLDYYALYAERKPEEELNAKDGERLMAAFHFDKEINKTHGVPFKFLVKPVRLADFLLTRLHLTKFLGRGLQRHQRTALEANGHQGQTI